MGGLTVQSQKGLSVCLKQHPVKLFCFLTNNVDRAQNKPVVEKNIYVEV